MIVSCISDPGNVSTNNLRANNSECECAPREVTSRPVSDLPNNPVVQCTMQLLVDPAVLVVARGAVAAMLGAGEVRNSNETAYEK